MSIKKTLGASVSMLAILAVSAPAFAQTDRSGCLSCTFPGDPRFGIVALRDVDQLRQVVDLSWINRHARATFTLVITLASKFVLVIR